MDVVGCCWMLLFVLGCCWMLLGAAGGCCWVQLDVVGLLLEVVGCYWVLMDAFKCRWAANVVGCCWVLLVCVLLVEVLEDVGGCWIAVFLCFFPLSCHFYLAICVHLFSLLLSMLGTLQCTHSIERIRSDLDGKNVCAAENDVVCR